MATPGSITTRRLDRRTIQTRVQGLTLLGADEFEATLKRMEAAVREEILQAGLQAGAEVLQEGMAERAREFSDRLARGIVVDVYPSTAQAKGEAAIGPNRRVQHLGYWAEFGTGTHGPKGRPYEIVARFFLRHRKSRRLRGQRMGTKHALSASGFGPVHSVEAHPGMRPRPFAVAAFVEDSGRALKHMRDVIWAELQRRVGPGAR
jgi:hypothetical protein